MKKYHEHIKVALQQGYHVDATNGVVYGIKGSPLSSKRGSNQRYATVSLVVRTPERAFMAVPLHKVIAYALYGDESFAPGVHVRHVDGDVDNNKGVNLKLGTPSENEHDKPFSTRARVGRTARHAQGAHAHNRGLRSDQVTTIREMISEGLSDLRIARKVGCSRTTVYDIRHRRTYND